MASYNSSSEDESSSSQISMRSNYTSEDEPNYETDTHLAKVKAVYLDHTFKGIKRKCMKKYIKSKDKGLFFGGCDDDAVHLFSTVDSERKLENNLMIDKYVDADCGDAFNGMHIHFFKNIDTGASVSSIEGWNGKICQKMLADITLETKIENSVIFEKHVNPSSAIQDLSLFEGIIIFPNEFIQLFLLNHSYSLFIRINNEKNTLEKMIKNKLKEKQMKMIKYPIVSLQSLIDFIKLKCLLS